MHGDHLFCADKSGSLYGIVDSHGEIVPDGQESKINVKFIRDQFHVMSKRRITRIIESYLIRLHDEPTWIPPRGPIRQRTAVDGIHIFYFPEVEPLASSVVHGMEIFDAFLLKPSSDFKI